MDAPATESVEEQVSIKEKGLSYSEQYDRLFGQYKANGEQLPIRSNLPKPDPEAQAAVPGAKKVLLSSVYATPKTNQWFNRTWNTTDLTYAGFMVFMHGLCLLAPATFSWNNLALFLGTYFITGCLGITLSFHRQLSHKSFTTPKWLEYALAYCGVLAVQGDPTEWVSSHRCGDFGGFGGCLNGFLACLCAHVKVRDTSLPPCLLQPVAAVLDNVAGFWGARVRFHCKPSCVRSFGSVVLHRTTPA